MKMSDKNNSFIILAICVTMVITSIVLSIVYYNINDRALLSKNISEAVIKEMYPLSVRCSYTYSGDTVCVVYTSSKK